MRHRRADGTAMRHGDDVAAAMPYIQVIDDRRYACDKIGEAFAVRGALGRGRKPERVRIDAALGIELLALEPLPVSQMLLRERGMASGAMPA